MFNSYCDMDKLSFGILTSLSERHKPQRVSADLVMGFPKDKMPIYAADTVFDKCVLRLFKKFLTVFYSE